MNVRVRVREFYTSHPSEGCCSGQSHSTQIQMRQTLQQLLSVFNVAGVPSSRAPPPAATLSRRRAEGPQVHPVLPSCSADSLGDLKVWKSVSLTSASPSDSPDTRAVSKPASGGGISQASGRRPGAQTKSLTPWVSAEGPSPGGLMRS